MRSSVRFACWVCVFLGLLLAPRRARAQSELKLEVVPVLGSNSPSVEGWSELSIRLENSSSAPISGQVAVRAARFRDEQRTLVEAPFSVAAKSRVHLLLPVHGLVMRAGEAHVTAVTSQGRELCDEQLPAFRLLEPLIFDLTTPSRLSAVLNSQPIPIQRHGPRSPVSGGSVSVTTPQINRTTGELVLPDLGAGYASATLVLASGRTLSSLTPKAIDPLFSWVMGGGALAIVIDRPEDLRSAWLEALAGGHVQKTSADPALAGARQFAVPVDPDGKSRFSGSPPRIVFESAKPSAELAATFFGLSGANLRVSPWGAAASYGLGEVHFLAFDPNTELGARDRWAKLEMIDLTRHAWDRISTVALPHAQAAFEDVRTSEVRRILDPNEGTRWTVIVSTLLLLMYAALAGPLNFYLAQRAGRPLRALLYLPLWAGLALCCIVVLGILGKGITGRARHLTLIEAGAGMARASVTRFRGLYGSRADDVTVRAARGSVLDVLGDPSEITRNLLVDEGGLRLQPLREKPWEIQVVREDGFTNLGAGISLLLGPDGQLTVKNRSARDLLGVIVQAPKKGLFYFPNIEDGQTVALHQGRPLGPVSATSPMGAHGLSLGSFQKQVDERAKGASAAWAALESVAGSETDFWPSDVPVLIAELEGGEGRTSDSGLRLDVDRVLVRVVGYGGVP